MPGKSIMAAAIAVSVLCACGGGGAASAPPPAQGPSQPGPPDDTAGENGGAADTYDVDTLGVPRFVGVSYIELSKIAQISRFRSGIGHDYSDGVESCRSMKHYFSAPDETAGIFSPVAGAISRVDSDWTGVQVRIRSDAQPAFTFVLFHVALSPSFKAGSRVAEGEEIGHHVGNATYSDIAVEVNVGQGRRLVSYFDTLTDAGFAPFKARGIAQPGDLVISRQDRDAAPLDCDGETFTSADPLDAWVALSS